MTDLLKVHESIGKLHGKVDMILANCKGCKAIADGNTRRIGKLEGWRSYIAGGIAAVLAVFSIAWLWRR